MTDWRPLFEKIKNARPAQCQHASDALGVLTQRDGVKCYKRYCLACGAPTSTGIAYEKIQHVKDTAIPAEQFHALREKSVPFGVHSQFRCDVWWVLYQSYMASWEWRKTRRRALDRTGGRCEECGGIAEHVHHRSYERIGAELDEDMSPLCARCHAEHHPHMRNAQMIFLRSAEARDAG